MRPTALVLLAILAGCGPRAPATAPPDAASGETTPPPSAARSAAPVLLDIDAAEVIASGLAVPWGLDFGADGAALVTERETGRVLRISPGAAPTEVARIEGLPATGEGGLLGLAVDPATPGVAFVFVNTGTESRIVRLGLADGRQETTVSGIPATSFHTGGRVAFGPDGALYVSVGDAQDGELAQDPTSLAGKILRYDPDGSIPADNPDPSSAVYALGFRNVEGMAWDAAGRPWATELGESTADELNRIEPGANYGWPRFEGPAEHAEYKDPALTWTPDEASPAGVAFAHGALWVAALRGQRLWRLPLDASGRVGDPEALLVGRFGRLRTVELAPDGSLWLATSNRDGRGQSMPDDDRIIRIPMVR